MDSDISPRQTEKYIHWDFKGTGGADPTDPTSPAKPWDTTSEAPGPHTIIAKAVLKNNKETVSVTADFTIK